MENTDNFLTANFTDQVDLNELVPSDPNQVLAPSASVQGQAAASVLLSTPDPNNLISTYRAILAENETGDRTTLNMLRDQQVNQYEKFDLRGAINSLSDPKLPIEEKQKVLENLKNQKLKDTRMNLLTSSIVEDSKGEKPEQMVGRATLADAVSEIYKSMNDLQGLRNAMVAKLDPVSGNTVGELAEAWVMPFGNSILTAKQAKAFAEQTGNNFTVFDYIKAFVMPGSEAKSKADALANLPPAKQMEFAQQLRRMIENNSGILFSNDNQFAQFDKVTNILEQGGYGSGQEFLDNISPLLDAVGIGQFLRGAGKTSKAAKAVEVASKELKDIPKGYEGGVQAAIKKATPENIFEPRTAPIPDQKIAERAKQVDIFEAERAKILGDSSALLEPGQVRQIKSELASLEAPSGNVKELAKELQASEKISYKEATKRAESQISALQADYEASTQRLTGMLDANAQAAKNEQRLAELDAKIAELKKGLPAAAGSVETPLAASIRRMEVNSVVHLEQPASVFSLYHNSNPSRARAAYSAILNDVTDETANALAGTNRVDALASAIIPKIGDESGRVLTKTLEIERGLDEASQITNNLEEMLSHSGRIDLTDAEKQSAKAKIENDFRSANGLTLNEAMSTFTLDGGRVKIGAVYGIGDSGFLRADEAVKQAMQALRHYGIREDEITLLRKEGLEHVPVDMKNIPETDGNYLVKVDTTHEIGALDIRSMEAFDVKRNWLDRIPFLTSSRKGSAARWALDAASMVDPRLSGGAVVATDEAARIDKILLTQLNEFATEYKKLDAAEQVKLDDYFKEANFKGLAFDQADLMARGFSPEAIQTVRDWRVYWDGIHYLENHDVIRTLNNNGYMMFKNAQDEFYAKPIPKNINTARVYDPALGDMRTLSKQELDDLYNQSGTVARFRRPVDINGEVAEHMMVRNTPTEYLRVFRNSDQVLNYKEGYFQIRYKAPKFVDQAIKDANGNFKYWKAIAVAGDTPEAERFAQRMSTTNQLPATDFRVRNDERALEKAGDAWWDLSSSSGRVAQRHRGQLLEDSTGLNHLGDHNFIENPVEAARKAANSIAGRTVMRPVIETAKERFIQQYGRFLPDNGHGGKAFPVSVDQIMEKGNVSSKAIADARTTWEYINYLENGYINSMDAGYKSLLYAISDSMGQKGFGKLERGLKYAAEVGPTHIGKASVFTAYLAANPIRQFVVQSHQMVRAFVYNPDIIIKGDLVKYTSYMLESVINKGNVASAEGKKFIEFMQGTGMFAAIDKNSLVRSALMSAADSNPVKKYLGAPFRAARIVGFDAGEATNSAGHLIAVYSKYLREGKDLSNKAVRDMAYSEARALSYDMNFAGDMPYNQTSPAMFLQFLQVPHKALAQATNRRLDRGTRTRMALADVVLWGVPGTLIADSFGDFLPDDKTMRDAILWGAESMLLNKYFSWATGEEQNIDFSTLAPYDMSGWSNFAKAMYSDGLSGMILNSPAGSLMLKDGSPLKNTLKSLARYMNIVEDDPNHPETALSVMEEAARMSSGYNNFVKARLMLEYGKKLDQYGRATDEKVSKMEAYAQILGFTTADARDLMKISMDISKDSKKYKEEVSKITKDIIRMYADKLQSPNTDPEFITGVSGAILRTFKDNPDAMMQANKEFAMSLSDPSNQLLGLMLKRAGVPDVKGYHDLVNRAPISEQDKKALLERYEAIRTSRVKE